MEDESIFVDRSLGEWLNEEGRHLLMPKKITLKNGLRMLLVPESRGLAATVLILVEAGSEYETKEINGLSHFLEHMVFKGTTNRPEPGMVARELDSLGAQSNAFTGHTYTGYWAKVRAKKLGKVIEIVSDIYLNPIFEEKEINKERGVVIEEINLYEDMPPRRAQTLFTSLLYGDQPAGWEIAGKKEIIKKLSREDFLRYRGLHYVPGKTLVVVAGAFDPEEVVRQVKTLFGQLAPKRRVRKAPVKEQQARPAILIKHKTSDQTHLVVGVRAFSIFDRRKYALQVLANVLGGGMSSRLFHRVRQELGAAYYIDAAAELGTDHGYFEVSSGADHTKVKEVIAAILEEFERLKKEAVPKKELEKAKEHLTGNLILSLESSDELANFYGGQEILTRSSLTPHELVARIQRVTALEIQSLAHTLFMGAKLNLAMIGPYTNAAPFKKMLIL